MSKVTLTFNTNKIEDGPDSNPVIEHNAIIPQIGSYYNMSKGIFYIQDVVCDIGNNNTVHCFGLYVTKRNKYKENWGDI